VQWQQLFHQFSPVPAPRTKLPTSFSLLLTPGIPFGTPVPRRGRWHLGCLFAYYPVCLCYLSVCSSRHSHPSPVVVPSYFHSRTEFASRLPINVLWLSGRGLAQSPRCPSFIKYFSFHGSCNCRGIRRNLEHSLQIEHWQFYLWSLGCSGSTWLSKINLNPTRRRWLHPNLNWALCNRRNRLPDLCNSVGVLLLLSHRRCLRLARLHFLFI